MAIQPSRQLAEFAASVELEAIPTNVIEKLKGLFLDWIGSALAGKGARPVEAIRHFAEAVGGNAGPSEILITRKQAAPYFAAMVNAASSHFAEQDDIHNGAVFHPGTVIFPVALALAQAHKASGNEFLVAAITGYEVGIRVGEFLGRSHYRIFHTTGTAGTVAAAATAGRLLRLPPDQMLDAFGSAGTQASGLWEFLRDAADSKQLHAAMAAANGLMAAQLAASGFKGATHILEGAQGMGAGMSKDADPTRLIHQLGERWATLETSIKYQASCRHTHPAADAFLEILVHNALTPDEIASVTTHVHQSALDVLGQVEDPITVHQAKFHMGTVIGLIARYGYAGVEEFKAAYRDPEVVDLSRKVSMVLDEEVDRAYPNRWIGKVTVETHDGRRFRARVDEPKGDPGNMLTDAELDLKFSRLASFAGGASESEAVAMIRLARAVGERAQVGSVFPSLNIQRRGDFGLADVV